MSDFVFVRGKRFPSSKSLDEVYDHLNEAEKRMSMANSAWEQGAEAFCLESMGKAIRSVSEATGLLADVLDRHITSPDVTRKVDA